MLILMPNGFVADREQVMLNGNNGYMLIGNTRFDADLEQVMLIGKIHDLMLMLLHERLGTHHVLDAVQLQPGLKLLEEKKI